MENKNVEEFKNFTRKEKNIIDICRHLDINDVEVWSIINMLRNNGINIITSGRGSDLTILNLDEQFMNNDNIYTMENLLQDSLRCMVISDTRLGSNYQQLTLTNESYINAVLDFDVDTVFHLGDLTEGLYPPKSPYRQSLFLTDTESQIEYVIDNYPHVEGVTTYFITGDQDYTHTKKNGIDIGRVISSERDDMKYLGYSSCLVNLHKMRMLLTHLKIGAFDRAKTVSYKQEEFISSLRSEDKFDLMLTGHLLVEDQMTKRDIKEISIPSLVATTPRIKNYSSVNHNVGYVILDINFTKNGKMAEANPIFAPYYQTIKNDYQKVKKLQLTKEEVHKLRGGRSGK